MIVQCDNCDTSFKLDESRVPPDGAWVRCSQCQEVFHVTPPGPGPAAARAPEPDFFELSDGPSQAARAAESAEFGLEMDGMMEGEDRPKRGGKGLKIVFWLLVLPLLLILLAVGALFALDRFHIMPQLVDPVRNLPGLNLILSRPAAVAPAAPGAPAPAAPGAAAPAATAAPAAPAAPTAPAASAAPDTAATAQPPATKPAAGPTDARGLKLSQVRGYFRMNQKAGKLFVIQGMVLNEEGPPRIGIIVRGRLNDTQGKTAQQAMVYAGKVFTSEQLQEIAFEEVQASLSKPEASDGTKPVITAGGSLPFMIVFANLPSNLAEFTAEVVGAESAAAAPGQR